MADRREAAQKAGDETEWTKALIREVQLRTGLHGYETAVRFLKDQPWPQGPAASGRARALLRAVADELCPRLLLGDPPARASRIDRKGRLEGVDRRADRGRGDGGLPRGLERNARRSASSRTGASQEFLDPNDYPKGMRDTLRDALAYLFAAHLSDTAGWTPSESNEVYRVDLAACSPWTPRPRRVRVETALTRSCGSPPCSRTWRPGTPAGRRKEGAFEARLERLRKLFAALTEEADRQRIVADLEGRLAAFRDVPWFAMGKAQLAIFVERPGSTGDLVRAERIAEEGRAAYPASVGGPAASRSSSGSRPRTIGWRRWRATGRASARSTSSTRTSRALKFRAFPLDLAARIAAQRNQYATSFRPPKRCANGDTGHAVGRMDGRAAGYARLQDPRDVRHAASERPWRLRRRRLGRRRVRRGRIPAGCGELLVSDLVLVLRDRPGAPGPHERARGAGPLRPVRPSDRERRHRRPTASSGTRSGS